MYYNYHLIANLRHRYNWVTTTSLYNRLTNQSIKLSTLRNYYCIWKIKVRNYRLVYGQYLTNPIKISNNNDQIAKFNRFTKVNQIPNNKIITNSRQVR